MLGKRSAQRGLFEADTHYLEFVGADTFYGFLASQRGTLFQDQDFAAFYCADNGRASVPPSLLAMALLLQTHDKVSDEEAKARADYDLRWKVALGIELEARPFAKSTLQLFRAQLILKEKMRAVFTRSLELAKQSGYLKERRLRVILDTTNILGRGAVQDTYNLLGEGIQQVSRALAHAQAQDLATWVQTQGLGRYFGSSLKGEAAVDWDDPAVRAVFLQSIVADAQRLLHLAQERQRALGAADLRAHEIGMAAQLLRQLIAQDVEVGAGAAQLKEGTARDRIVSVQDPEMRHGRKSHSKRFDGHKAAIAVDAESQLITAAEVLPGNAADASPALSLTEASETNTGLEVEETIGDCAFGDGQTRLAFAQAQRPLIAKVPHETNGAYFPKPAFQIDVAQLSCTCPGGQTTTRLMKAGSWVDRDGQKQPSQSFVFATATCQACPLQKACFQAKAKRGRTVHLHPQEALLQTARAFQDSPAFGPYRQLRQTVEHRLARLVQLGIRQARYVGRKKTLFQLLMAATVANLTLMATKTGQMQEKIGFILSVFESWRIQPVKRTAALDPYAQQMVHFCPQWAISFPKMAVFG
jgi:hypothetical protein